MLDISRISASGKCDWKLMNLLKHVQLYRTEVTEVISVKSSHFNEVNNDIAYITSKWKEVTNNIENVDESEVNMCMIVPWKKSEISSNNNGILMVLVKPCKSIKQARLVFKYN